jgi:hypothetical protein
LNQRCGRFAFVSVVALVRLYLGVAAVVAAWPQIFVAHARAAAKAHVPAALRVSVLSRAVRGLDAG